MDTTLRISENTDGIVLETYPTHAEAVWDFVQLGWEDDRAALLNSHTTIEAGGRIVGLIHYEAQDDDDDPVLVWTFLSTGEQTRWRRVDDAGRVSLVSSYSSRST